MARRWTVRRVAKWAGTVVLVLMLALYAGFPDPDDYEGFWSSCLVYYTGIPPWLAFLFVGVTTGALWWLDANAVIRPGHCRRCAYDLTGNVSGVCPECGCRVPDPDPAGERQE
jgi:hypothetical protein